MSGTGDLHEALAALDGARYEVMLRDPSYITAAGEPGLSGPAGWTELQVVPASVCEHESTACMDCAGEWAQDYYARVISRDGQIVLASPGAPLERA